MTPEAMGGVTWTVKFDKQLATDMFRAESDRYNRKVGILTAVLLGLFAIGRIVAIGWSLATGNTLATEDDPSGTSMYLYAFLFIALTAFGVFIAVRPGAATAFRNRSVIRRMTEQLGGARLSFATQQAGISCRLGEEPVNIPYAALTGSAVVDGTPWLTTADARDG